MTTCAGRSRSRTLAFAVAALVWSLTDSAPLPGAWLHKHLANFSYSLYVAHFPAVVLLAAVLQELTGAGLGLWPTLPALASFCGILAASVVWGYAVSRISEAHTDRLRRLLVGWLEFLLPGDSPRRHTRRGLPEAGVGIAVPGAKPPPG